MYSVSCENSLWKSFYPPEEKVSRWRKEMREIEGPDVGIHAIDLNSDHPMWKYVIIER